MMVFKIFLSMVLLALAGCAALDKTPWKQDTAAFETAKVRWLRMAGQGFIDQDGVCNVQLVDSEKELRGFSSQLEKCRTDSVRGHVTEQMKAVEVVTLRVFKVKTTSDVENYLIGQYGMRYYKAMIRQGNQSSCQNGIGCWMEENRNHAAGFYFQEGGWCGIVISKGFLWGLGHEFKHCTDGDYHYASMRWKAPPKVFVPQQSAVTQKTAE